MDVNGLLLIDKPKGITSHDVISKLRGFTKIKQIGHTGTLDPEATGLLVVCVGRSTKITRYLVEEDKVYEVGFRLGVETNTYDLAGEVIATKEVAVTEEEVRKALTKFEGTIDQRPPIFSAIKVKGKKLYEYARAKETVDIPTRTVTIFSIQLQEFRSPEGKLHVHCSKGTYVRSLVHDLGQTLQTGAVATEIRRTKSGSFEILQALTLESIEASGNPLEFIQKKLLPISHALRVMPHLKIGPKVAPRIMHGNGLRPQDMESCLWGASGGKPKIGKRQPVLLIDQNDEAIALASFDGRSSVSIQRVL